MILYHGSNVEVKKPTIIKGRRLLDFGVGFYLTSDLEQATKWARRKTLNQESGKETVNIYEFDRDKAEKELKIQYFDSANIEWLDYVSQNRQKINVADDYDIVIGPVANEPTIRTINDYIKDRFDADIAIKLLKSEKLKDQYVFKTAKALKTLKYITMEENNEKT
ncbi:MAG: DUF3990 domain-containing protein [Firmicutes bacterium]|nr:DUF3990 domain-containing protein [Bacillota bacterium]